MNWIELQEGAPSRSWTLDDDTADQLIEDGLITAQRVRSGRWEIRAATKVGVVRVGETVVRIAPKVAIRRLFFLLGYAGRLDWRRALVDVTGADELVPVLAEAFVRQAEGATRAGLLQGYVQVDDQLTVLRGRLREQDQIRHRYGLAVPLLVRYDDYTVDIAENRLLRSATDRLLGLPGVPEPIRRRLRRLRIVLGDVSPLPRDSPLPRWTEHRLNGRYHVALRLAELVLGGNAVDDRRGDVRMDGFLVDMAKVFEDFVTEALSRALGGDCKAQDAHFLDIAGEVEILPDLVWYRDGPAAVIDAKYKAEKPAGFPHADLYQVLAYCTALHVSVGHLIYAKGNGPAQAHQVRNAGIRIVAHALDLDAADEELLDQVRRIADSVKEASDPSTVRLMKQLSHV